MTDRFPRVVGRRSGIDCRMGRADLALAYEMQNSGITWRNISNVFGVHDRTIYRAIKRAEQFGLDWLKKP